MKREEGQSRNGSVLIGKVKAEFWSLVDAYEAEHQPTERVSRKEGAHGVVKAYGNSWMTIWCDLLFKNKQDESLSVSVVVKDGGYSRDYIASTILALEDGEWRSMREISVASPPIVDGFVNGGRQRALLTITPAVKILLLDGHAEKGVRKTGRRAVPVYRLKDPAKTLRKLHADIQAFKPLSTYKPRQVKNEKTYDVWSRKTL